MVAGLSALQKFNFFSKPVNERQAGGVNLYTTKPAQFGTFKGAETGVSGINGELTPTLKSSGTTFTNGVGHSKYGAFEPYYA